MNSPIKTTILALAVLTHAPAEDSAIATAETKFRQASAEAITPVTERYITALGNLALKFERSGKTADARAVTAELARVRKAINAGTHPLDFLPGRASTPLEDTSPSGSTASAATGDLFLAPDQATLTGSLAPDDLTRVLRGFFGEEDIATWSLENFTPGTYDLILDYACPEEGRDNAGGGTISLIAGNAKTTVVIEPQGTQNDFRKKTVGGVTLTAPPVEISIGAEESETPSGVFRLRSLILRPR